MQLSSTVIADCFYKCEMQQSIENIERTGQGHHWSSFLLGLSVFTGPGQNAIGDIIMNHYYYTSDLQRHWFKVQV